MYIYHLIFSYVKAHAFSFDVQLDKKIANDVKRSNNDNDNFWSTHWLVQVTHFDVIKHMASLIWTFHKQLIKIIFNNKIVQIGFFFDNMKQNLISMRLSIFVLYR